MALFISGTLTELAKKKKMSLPTVWHKIFKQNDLELTEAALEIHKRILAEKEMEKEKTQQILNEIKSEAI
jgi:DNA-binding transcriptional regulator/RsmH inhibitor MraZ